MPQMSPILWMIILMMSTASMIQMNSMLYFEFKKKKMNMNKKMEKKKLNWKW
uniref:ATP synthase F0 subunit 8 n=1 Tax=Pochazia confusa TaxID=1308480 RepID=UPI001EDD5E39|nr:ATP synthase F0 subunit 8 [Pochazia confusa]UJT96865.1 ATP synthase F0 subunit 8 [Pochazia confusa]